MTAAQIEAALRKVPHEERVALAAQLFALALSSDDEDATIDEPLPELSEDRELLLSHLQAKRANR